MMFRNHFNTFIFVSAFCIYYAIKMVIDNRFAEKSRSFFPTLLKLMAACVVMALVAVIMSYNHQSIDGAASSPSGASEADAERAAACLGHRETEECKREAIERRQAASNPAPPTPGAATP